MKLAQLREIISVVSFRVIIDAYLRDAANNTIAFLFDSTDGTNPIDTVAITDATVADKLNIHNLGAGLSAANIAALDADANVKEIVVSAVGDKWTATVDGQNLATEGFQRPDRVNLTGVGELIELLMGGTVPSLGDTVALIVDQVNAKVYAIPVGGANWNAEPNVNELPVVELTEFRRASQGFFESA